MAAMTRISSKPLQYYRHNYAKVCMTGLLGCRWHRYKQSTKGSTMVDIAWFIFLLLVSLFVITCFYSTLVIRNDEQDINEYIWSQTESWLNYYMMILAAAGILFTYILILLLLCLCHIVQGHQLYLHVCHRVLLILVVAMGTTLYVLLDFLWKPEWTVIYISLQMYGPFLQIGSVCLVTLLSWIVSYEWFLLSRLEYKIASLLCYGLFMMGLYLSPLLIHSPCVIEAAQLPQKPRLFAHRGASRIAPENTLIAFEKAAQNGAYGIEFDVRISEDGVPFIMHDDNLKRTTNIHDIFPNLTEWDASRLNISNLLQLNTGQWFLKHGQRSIVNSLSDKDRAVYGNQTVPTFLEVLQLARRHQQAVLFDISLPVHTNPFYNKTYSSILDLIPMADYNYSTVFWPNEVELNHTFSPRIQTLSRHMDHPAQTLKHYNYSGVLVEHIDFDQNKLSSYKQQNVSTIVYKVNSAWMFSYYWCLGLHFVVTDDCHILSKQDAPIWLLSPKVYQTLWVTVDVISAVLILCMFVIQRRRLDHNRFKPDTLSLSSSLNGHNSWSSKRTRRSMKEKLILRDVQADSFDFEPEDLGIDSNGYEVTVNATEGAALAQAFHSNRTSYASNAESNYGNGVVEHHANRQSYISESHSENGDVFFNTGNSSDVLSNNNSSRPVSTGSNVGTDERERTVTEIDFTRNGAIRKSYHDASISSNPSESDMPETEFR